MKKIFLVLVIVFAGVTVNAQDIAMVDNNLIKERSSNKDYSDRLDQTNSLNFSKKFAKKANQLAKEKLRKAIRVGLKEGYTYKNKLHWAMVLIDEANIEVYVFVSNINFTDIKFKKVNDLVFEDYILNNY